MATCSSHAWGLATVAPPKGQTHTAFFPQSDRTEDATHPHPTTAAPALSLRIHGTLGEMTEREGEREYRRHCRGPPQSLQRQKRSGMKAPMATKMGRRALLSSPVYGFGLRGPEGRRGCCEP